MRRTALALSFLTLAGPSLSGQQYGSPTEARVPAPIEAACPHTPLSCGASITGTIDESDCRIANGSYDDTYVLDVPKEHLLTIQMDSQDFDSVLYLRDELGMQPFPPDGALPAGGTPTTDGVIAYYGGGRRLAVIVTDDNSGGGRSARVETGTDSPGRWFVTAQAKKGRSRGSYTLTVKCEKLTCQPNPASICLNRMRFRVNVQYVDMEDWSFSPSGSGDKAKFDFPGPPLDRRGSAEVSVTDHCAENGHFWVSSKASVNGAFRITVTDTRTGAEKVYGAASGEAFQPVEDRQAFPCP